MSEQLTLSISSIITDGLQMRASLNESAVNEYAQDMKAGVVFPAVEVVFNEENAEYYLVNGHHRIAAATRADFNRIDAEVVGEGDLEHAQYMALQANRTNSVRRSVSDRENVILKALAHPECDEMTETELAEFLGVSRREIFRVRDKNKKKLNPERTRDLEYESALSVIRADCPKLADFISVGIVKVPREEVIRAAGMEAQERKALLPVMEERRLTLKQAEKVICYVPRDESLAMSIFLDFVERNPETRSFYFRNTQIQVDFTVNDA